MTGGNGPFAKLLETWQGWRDSNPRPSAIHAKVAEAALIAYNYLLLRPVLIDLKR